MRTLFSDRFFLGGMILFAVTIVGLQVYGGAYQAEFTGHPDEAAHFVSSLLVRDYIGQWPLPDAMPWATQYYIHYPKVAIGHWPPGYYVALALWWLVFPVSRTSALWLNIAMALMGMAMFYDLARRIRPGWPSIIAGLLLLWTPVVQEANAMVMADLPSLVAALAVFWTLTRLLEEPGELRLLGVVAALGVALFVKGTGVGLLAAPVGAFVLSGLWKQLPLGRTALILGGGVVSAAALYLWQYRGSFEAIRGWAGMNLRIPWRIDLLPLLAGVGILVLAVAGLYATYQRRQPAAMAAASVLVSLTVASYFVRAMQEPRHFIAAIPALLLLSLAVYAWLEGRSPRLAVLAALGGLSLFPFTVYTQRTEGFRELAAQLRLPARMLVSSRIGWREGPWIAVVALGEARPQSTIARATKLLAESDWNGLRYKLRVNKGEEIERSLDGAALEIVVLDDFPGGTLERAPHHLLLHGYLRASPSWRSCARTENLEAYCRTLPPRFPRKPLRVDLRSRLGYEVEEH